MEVRRCLDWIVVGEKAEIVFFGLQYSIDLVGEN